MGKMPTEKLIERFKENHGKIAADMLTKYGEDVSITTQLIADKIGTSRQNVHQLLKRIGKLKPKYSRGKVRPWGSRIRFKPEIEAVVRYLFNRFEGKLTHLGGRQFRVNDKKILVTKRDYIVPGTHCLSICTSGYMDRDSADYKVVLHAGQIFVVPFVRDYLPISEMPMYHNRYDLLD